MALRMHLDHLVFGGSVTPLDLDGTSRFGDRLSVEWDVEIGETRPCANVLQDAGDPIARTGDRAVDALVSHQQRALDAMLTT